MLNLKPQVPASNIYQSRKYPDCHFYTVACQCTDPDHKHDLVIEIDNETHHVAVCLYVKAFSPTFTQRLRYIWTLLTKGQLSYEASLLMDKQQALNYGSALIESVQELENVAKTK